MYAFSMFIGYSKIVVSTHSDGEPKLFEKIFAVNCVLSNFSSQDFAAFEAKEFWFFLGALSHPTFYLRPCPGPSVFATGETHF